MSISKASMRRSIEAAGGASAVLQALREYKEMFRTFEEMKPGLTRQYPDKWVGYYKGEIVVADSLEQLVRSMKKAGIPKGSAVLDFMSTKEEIWILAQ